MTAVVEGAPVQVAGHELLVRLAGRLPDDVVWRLRDWLAAGALGSVAAVLPRALLRHRLGVTDLERELLWRCVGERSPSSRMVDTVLPLPELDDPGVAFSAGTVTHDLAAMSATSVAAGHAGVEELRQSWRGPRGEQRVLVVLGAERPWELTGTLQRLLRVHGDRTPCVEVLPLEMEVPSYHQAAVVGSSVLFARPPAPADDVATPDPAGAFGALTGT
ncbi:hypothetical protein [Pseudonocardia endophytica]|uniref:Uncharacterized protein n=1 Tax=Pseudonocardia endophytica TaxID=401976 RepID=A0A4R1I5D7_PSEEN|nr:hypothetical protein [Pseudonocardia endophytica]TCK27829.1 hypothetical protein EV378_3708 [Pseudonocardia endophytica]